jgi:hypothetical protein
MGNFGFAQAAPSLGTVLEKEEQKDEQSRCNIIGNESDQDYILDSEDGAM